MLKCKLDYESVRRVFEFSFDEGLTIDDGCGPIQLRSAIVEVSDYLLDVEIRGNKKLKSGRFSSVPCGVDVQSPSYWFVASALLWKVGFSVKAEDAIETFARLCEHPVETSRDLFDALGVSDEFREMVMQRVSA